MEEKMSTSLRKTIWDFWNLLGKRAAQSYIAGPELQDAMRVCNKLSEKGFSSTIGFWNSDNDAHDKVSNAYLTGIKALKEKNMHCYLSIKLPAIGFSHQLLSAVLLAARQDGIRVHFDSLGPETVDQTRSMITESLPIYNNLSCTLPGRWRRSLQDADWAVEHGLTVRVVKGQWIDPGAPDIDMQESFLDIIAHLTGRARFVAVASHDTWLAKEAIKRLHATGTPCEMELLYGLPAHESIKLARDLGVNVRFYIPYGNGFLPYCLSWARRNPCVLWWIIKDFVRSNSLPSIR
jgi:proline dehydrogenase